MTAGRRVLRPRFNNWEKDAPMEENIPNEATNDTPKILAKKLACAREGAAEYHP